MIFYDLPRLQPRSTDNRETSFQEVWVHGKKRVVEGRYRYCDQCGVEYADEENINFNAQKMREIRND